MESATIPSISVLFADGAAEEGKPPHDSPDYFKDLAIDQIIEAVTAGYDDYDLKPLFAIIPHEHAVIDERQAVFRDVADPVIDAGLRRFAASMRATRERTRFAENSHYPHQAAARLVEAIGHYGDGLAALVDDLTAPPMRSSWLSAFHRALRGYIAGAGFVGMREEVAGLRAALGGVRYTVLIRDNNVTVRSFEEEPDYNAIIAELFEKFQQGSAKPHELEIDRSPMMNHVAGELLHGVAKLNPEVFARLEAFVTRYRHFIDPVIARFDREIHFYLAWTDFTARIAKSGIAFCYPVLADDRTIHVEAGCDLALAHKLSTERRGIVTNDFQLDGAERILVVTGPNQGGKTTFARTFGQMHYFANLGCTVPGTAARLHLFDRMFTHFEREEALTTLRGKLHDDLVRVHTLLEAATADSIIIMNEIFNSTALKDASFLATSVLRRIIARGAIAVCVTFMDELASLGPETVSLTSMVLPDNPAERSFKIVRRRADGLAYALSIAEKHGVTYRRLKERLA